MRGCQLILCLTLLCLALPGYAQYFRYKDKDGRVVLSQSIPSDRVPYGYEVVDARGHLIKRVEPQLTDDQYRFKLQQEEEIAACRAAVRRVNNLYQTLDDIDYIEQQQLENIETSIANAKANLAHVQNQRRALEAQAAQRDLEGKAIPNELLDNIEEARAQEQNIEDEIDARFDEKLAQRNQYSYDRKVFQLKDCNEGLPPRTS